MGCSCCYYVLFVAALLQLFTGFKILTFGFALVSYLLSSAVAIVEFGLTIIWFGLWILTTVVSFLYSLHILYYLYTMGVCFLMIYLAVMRTELYTRGNGFSYTAYKHELYVKALIMITIQVIFPVIVALIFVNSHVVWFIIFPSLAGLHSINIQIVGNNLNVSHRRTMQQIMFKGLRNTILLIFILPFIYNMSIYATIITPLQSHYKQVSTINTEQYNSTLLQLQSNNAGHNESQQSIISSQYKYQLEEEPNSQYLQEQLKQKRNKQFFDLFQDQIHNNHQSQDKKYNQTKSYEEKQNQTDSKL